MKNINETKKESLLKFRLQNPKAVQVSLHCLLQKGTCFARLVRFGTHTITPLFAMMLQVDIAKFLVGCTFLFICYCIYLFITKFNAGFGREKCP